MKIIVKGVGNKKKEPSKIMVGLPLRLACRKEKTKNEDADGLDFKHRTANQVPPIFHAVVPLFCIPISTIISLSNIALIILI